MWHDISSSDNEEDRTPPLTSQPQSQRVTKYECPADFVPYRYSSSVSGLLDSSSDHAELWLIKAPARFDPKDLAGLKVSLSGLEKIRSTSGATPQIYSVLGSSTGSADLHLLTSSKNKEKNASLSTSVFTGVLSVSESYGDPGEDQGLIAIPAAPAPSIPPGLRQRFQPFGNSTPVHPAENIASTSLSPPKRLKLDPDTAGEEQGQKKKKKKKKDKRRREEERAKEVHIKQEVMSYDYGDVRTPEPAMKEEEEEEEMVEKIMKMEKDSLGQVAKQEPMDTSYREVDSPVKKKKKKKKKAVDE